MSSLAPTSTPSGSPLAPPSPYPTNAPTQTEHNDNCLVLKEGEISAIKPSPFTTSSLFNSQCVVVPSKSNIIRIQSIFIQSLPTTLYQTMLVTSYPMMESDLIDEATRKLKLCKDICNGQDPADCECIEGQVRKQASTVSPANSLYFMLDNTKTAPPSKATAKYFTIFSDVSNNIFINNIFMNEFSLFNGLVKLSPLSFELPPMGISNSLLSNINYVGGITGKVEKVMIVLPHKEEDSRLELTAIPLLLDDPMMISKHSKSCLIDDDVTCHVWLDPSMDYNIQVQNNGKKLNVIELSVYEKAQMKLSHLHLGKNHGKNHGGKYVTVIGIVYLSICVLVVILVIAAFRKGHKATRSFVKGMGGLFSKERKHYLPEAYTKMGEGVEEEEEDSLW